MMMKNYFDLTGQVAVITGCSTGLGVQMAKALASQGAKIAALARRQNMLDEVAAQITEEFGVEAVGISCDITDSEKVSDTVRKIMEQFGRIDILINNAGTGAVAPAEDITDEQFENEINIDLFGSFKVAREVAKQAMLPAGYGRIINIASMYGLVGNKIAPCAPYHAAKGGVVNMTRALASEWGEKGITVNAICPGYFYTPLTEETLNSEFFQNYAKQMIPSARYGNEGELDTAALFLSSQFSAYVNGVILPVDGGYTAM
ncbi:MAG: SDR family oxidoreductase [Oscillospiraceae bacterium]|nr:SDR family oxidoreductase [Oscillospiraceae bacterium]